MQIESQPIENSNVNLLKINLTKDDYLGNYEKNLKLYTKNVEIKGFRKGMAPIGMIRKKYGEAILYDELTKLVDKHINNYIKENNLNLIGHLVPSESAPNLEININEPKDYTFEFEYCLSPEVNFDFDHTFTRYQVDITESMIDEEVSNVMKYFKSTVDSEEPIKDNDLFKISIKNSKSIDTESLVSIYDLSDIGKEQFIGKKVGDTLTGKAIEWFEKEENFVKYILNIDKLTDEMKSEIHDDMEVSIIKVQTEVIPTELSAEQISQITRDEKKTSIEDLREALKSQIEKEYQKTSNNLLYSDIYNYIVNDLPIDLPIDFIRKWLKSQKDSKFSETYFEENKIHLIKQFKWDIVYNQYIKLKEIKVKMDDIVEHISSNYRRMMMQYGMGQNEDLIKKFVDEDIKDKTKFDKAVNEYLEKKFFESIVNEVKTNIQIVSEQEIKDIIAERNKKEVEA